jgi:hypothetical protein
MRYNLKKVGNLLRCPKCGYEWISKSKRIYVKCPSCRSFFKDMNNVTKKYLKNWQYGRA